MPSFFGELKRRNVVKVAVAYAIVGWLLIEIASTVLPTFGAPEWVLQTITFVIMLGFPLALILSWAFDLTPQGVVRTATSPGPEGATAVGGRKLDFAIIGALVLALAFVVYNYESEDAVAPSPDIVVDTFVDALPLVVTADQRDVLPNSVAVLPFDNLSLDPENAFFAAGIHESTLNQLAKIRDLNVIARTSVLQYEEDPPPIPEIAAALKVEMVMEGSVRYANDRVLITAQLIDGQTGAHLWSDEYNRDLADIFAVQAEIATAIATALEAEFSPAEQSNIERGSTTSPEAYALYLRALAVVGNATTADTSAGASVDFRSYLDQAIAIDPQFASAHALKAVDYATSMIRPTRLTDELVLEDRVRLARYHADTALDIDPSLGLGHDALAQTYRFTRRWEEAQNAFDRAIRLAPNDPQILQQFATFSQNAGDLGTGLASARRLSEINPILGRRLVSYQLMIAGDYAAAIASAHRALDTDPPHHTLYSTIAISEALRGNNEAAIEYLGLADSLVNTRFVAFYQRAETAYGYSRAGRPEDAKRIFDDIEEMSADYRIGAGNWAQLYLAINDETRALEWLRVAADERYSDAGYINSANIAANSFDDPVLEQPEFIEARKNLGFPLF